MAWQQLLATLTALTVLALLLPGPSRWADFLSGRAAGAVPGAGAVAAGQTAITLFAALLVWVLLLWGSAVALVALAGRLPGPAGRGGRAMLARIAPGVARKLVLTVVGASMVTGLAACGTGPAAAASVSGNSEYGPSPHDGIRSDIGGSNDAAMGRSGISGGSVGWTSVEGSAVQLRPGPLEPAAGAGAGLLDPAAGAEAGPTGRMNIDWPTLPARTWSGSPADPVDIDWPDPPAPVVVLAGDSLWSIAARDLPDGAGDAQIEKATQDWYAANASVIGRDPDLILPGQILQPPSKETGHHS